MSLSKLKKNFINIFRFSLIKFFTVFLTLVSSSQTTIYSESFGSTSSDVSVNTFTGYQNKTPINYSGSGSKISKAHSSNTGYYPLASDSANVFFNNTNTFYITGLNTSNYYNIKLSMGIFKNNDALNGSDFKISYSTDSINWVLMSYSLMTTRGSGNTWVYKTFTDTIPSSSKLYLRFVCSTSSGTKEYRIDDVKLSGSLKIVVPVKLIEFTATKTPISNQLFWSTASEFDNEKFVVERSSDCFYWEKIYEVPGQMRSYSILQYRFVDLNPKTINYYRLKQVDYNGDFEYSKIVVIVNTKSDIICNDIFGREIINTNNGFYIITDGVKVLKVIIIK